MENQAIIRTSSPMIFIRDVGVISAVIFRLKFCKRCVYIVDDTKQRVLICWKCKYLKLQEEVIP